MVRSGHKDKPAGSSLVANLAHASLSGDEDRPGVVAIVASHEAATSHIRAGVAVLGRLVVFRCVAKVPERL